MIYTTGDVATYNGELWYRLIYGASGHIPTEESSWWTKIAAKGDAGADSTVPGPQGDPGVAGVVAATSPITYNSGTQTVGIDQTLVSLDAARISSGTFQSARLGKIVGVTSTQYSGVTGGGGSLIFTNGAGSTISVAAGALTLAPVDKTGSISYVGFYVTSSAMSSGQAVLVVCYNADSYGKPSTLAWSQSITVGTSGSSFLGATLTQNIPTQSWMGIFNPSTNAGSATFTSVTPVSGPFTITPSSGNSGRHCITIASQGASVPNDVSAYPFSGASSWSMVGSTPGLYGRAS
jgi:hypothetical protein